MSQILMPAIVVRETEGKGSWNTLVFDQVPRPSVNSGEVLVQVEACSANRADLLQRRGLYPPPPGASPLLGLDFAGYVLEMASDVEGWHLEDRVFGIVAGGGYGRYIAVCADHLLPIPETLSFMEASAAAEVFLVAYLNLFLEAQIQSGETLFIHGGGSGVGTAAIQLAREANVTVVITAGSDEKVQRCLDLGASYGINYKEEDFVQRVWELTQGEGVDVILDWIGAPYLNKHLEILKLCGRLILIGLMGGNRTDVSLAPLLTKRLRLVGSVLRSRSKEEKAALTLSFRERVLPLLTSGKVRPIVDRIYPIQAAEEAHRHMLESHHFGKIVLTWQDVYS
jgi:putative PIG3 family NAD(P)H quinone oxidoreductase